MKQLLLLASIYPLFLFFVISFAYAYTVRKPETNEFNQIKAADLFRVNFLSPVPTTEIPQTEKLETVKEQTVSEPARIESTQSKAEPVPASDSASRKTSTSSAVDTKEIADQALDMETSVSTGKVQITPLPTVSKESIQEAKAKSVVIMERDTSSTIIPSESSVVIEND